MNGSRRSVEFNPAALAKPAAGPEWRRVLSGKLNSGNGVPLAVGWAVCAAILILTAIVLLTSFLVDFPIQIRFSLENYRTVLNGYLVTEVIPNTVFVGLGTVAVALAFGIPLAWLLHRTNLPCANIFLALIGVSIIVPGFLRGIGWILLLSPNVGFINRFLMDYFGFEKPIFDIGTLTGIAFIQGLMMTSTLVFLFAGPMRSLDPSLEEASEISGARRWTTIRWVVVPLLRPAVLGGAIYVFMTAISLFEVAALLGGLGGKNPVLATELFLSIYTLTASVPQYGVSGVYGALIAIPSLVALYYYYVTIRESHRYVTVTGRGYVARIYDLGSFKLFGVLFVLFYLALAVFLPLIVLIWASLLPYLQLPSWDALSAVSLKSYQRILNLPNIWTIVGNTAVLVVSVSICVMVLSFMISWIVTRTKLRVGALMDNIVMLPHAFPNIGFALALLMVSLVIRLWFPSFPFYGTVSILVLAHVITRMSYGTRVTNAALLQISRELEEAAYICGSKQIVVWWKVIVPVISRSLVFLCLWTGLLSLREVSMALILSGPDNQVIATYIWRAWLRGDLNVAAALGVIMVFVLGALFLIMQGLTGRDVRVSGAA